MNIFIFIVAWTANLKQTCCLQLVILGKHLASVETRCYYLLYCLEKGRKWPEMVTALRLNINLLVIIPSCITGPVKLVNA